MKEEEIKRIIDERVREALPQAVQAVLSDFLFVDRYEFQKHLQLLNGRNITVGRGTGTKIATEGYIDANNVGQKLGFFGTTPVIQPSAITSLSLDSVSGTGDDSTINANSTKIVDTVGDIRNTINSLGLARL